MFPEANLEEHECYQLTKKICKLKHFSQCPNHLQLSPFLFCIHFVYLFQIISDESTMVNLFQSSFWKFGIF